MEIVIFAVALGFLISIFFLLDYVFGEECIENAIVRCKREEKVVNYDPWVPVSGPIFRLIIDIKGKEDHVCVRRSDFENINVGDSIIISSRKGRFIKYRYSVRVI